jgi:hypothetical protein
MPVGVVVVVVLVLTLAGVQEQVVAVVAAQDPLNLLLQVQVAP